MPRTGGCVIASNHTMGPDYVVLGLASPRQIYYMAKMEIFAANPLLRRFLMMVGTFPVRRGMRDEGALAAASDLVRGGKVLGMFPEGTRSRTGILQRGRSGAVRIALEAGVPVVPAVVINAHQVLPGFKPGTSRGDVVVRFGPPFVLEGDPGDAVDIRQGVERTMRAIAELLPHEQRGVYAQPQVKTEAAAR